RPAGVPAPRPDRVASDVLCNVEQPGREPRPRLIALARAVDTQKHLLRQVLRVLAVAQHPEEMPEDPRAVAVQQLGKRPLVIVAHAQHQADIRIVIFRIRESRLAMARQRRGPQHVLSSPSCLTDSSANPKSKLDRPSHAGRRMLNVLPLPSTLSTSMLPPIRSR